MEDDPTYDISVVGQNGELLKWLDGDRAKTIIECESRLRSAVTATLGRYHILEARIVLALVDDADIRVLNEKHLGHDWATDVLAFDLRDEQTDQTSGCTKIEGDLVLSIETAAREARRRDHDLTAEVSLYAVHGTLHLLGFDDHAEDAAHGMHELEDSILKELGFGRVFRAEERRD